ncbi:MAG: serine/threonine-protein kinase [Burkholderiales bacterium]
MSGAGAVGCMEPRTLGRYELLAELGKGAMGVVYRANDPLLDRLVAIKTVSMSLDPQEMAEYETRFYQEAKAAGSLNHPNIVTIYDVGKSGNLAYMAMEFLQGEELRSLLAGDQPLPVARAVDISAQVAEGLAYAHQHGVVHRDVKPANIMLSVNGRAKITDFGIARMRSAEVKTQTGIVLGSPRYMSPEQVAGKRAEPRSDIFSLGVILYEMLTGRPPFTGEDVTSVMFQIMNLVPPPPSSINARVPEVLDFIVAKAIAKAVEDRYAGAEEFAQDLREVAKQIDTTVHVLSATRPPVPPKLDRDAAQALAQSLPVTRRADAIEVSTLGSTSLPALGLSRAFDSLDATMRLAINTGMVEELKDYSESGKYKPLADPPAGAPNGTPSEARAIVGAMRRGPGWTDRDKLIFAASVAGATILGVIIVFV